MLAQLSLALRDSPFMPIIAVINNDKAPHVELVEFARDHQIAAQVFPCRAAWDWGTVKALRRYLADERIALVQSHGYKSDTYALLASRFQSLPRLATCHPWIRNSRRGRFYAAIDQRVLTRFHHLVAVSDSVQQELVAAKFPREKISLIENGIDLQPFTPVWDRDLLLQEQNLPSDSLIIGCVGRLDPEKGQTVLLDACARLTKDHPAWILLLAGGGTQQQILQEQAQRLGIADRVRFLGPIDHIPRFLAMLNVFVMPSWTEGTPMALLEAMAAKCAVVATAVGQVPKLIEHLHSGYLVTPGEAEELEKGIRYVHDHPQHAQRMASMARERVAREFSAKKMAAAYQEVYHHLIQPLTARRQEE